MQSKSARRQAALYVALLTITLLLLAFSASAPLTQLRRGVGFAMAPIQNVLREAGQGVSSFFADAQRDRSAAPAEPDSARRRSTSLQTANQLAREPARAEPTADRLLQVRSSLA